VVLDPSPVASTGVMLIQKLIQYSRRKPQFGVARAAYRVGRFYRAIGLLAFDVVVVLLLIRGLGVDTYSPLPFLLSAALCYPVGWAILRRCPKPAKP